MSCVIVFWSYTWNKERWGKNHYLCSEDKAEVEFNGYYFTSKSFQALQIPLSKAKNICPKISTFAKFAIV